MRREVLDHGYVEYVEGWGSDERVIEAARMSTGKGFQGWGVLKCKWCEAISESGTLAGKCPGGRGMAHENREGFSAGDEKLLRFLYENKHATPFEMAGLVIEVQAPIFVFREWHRHRTQSYNEMSARYVPLPDVNYIPTAERCLMGGGSNKQAQGTGATLTEIDAHNWIQKARLAYVLAQEAYEEGLRLGIPKEIARLPVPVARYSRMRASANLRNWLAFLTLRMAPNAQWEIRQFADAVGGIVAQRFPRTWELFAGAGSR